jgi:hypothetical protein
MVRRFLTAFSKIEAVRWIPTRCRFNGREIHLLQYQTHAEKLNHCLIEMRLQYTRVPLLRS